MKRTAFLIFVFFLCVNSNAQKESADCPVIYITTSIEENSPKEYKRFFKSTQIICLPSVVVLTADVKNLDPKIKPTFQWKISSGKIISGQGTSSIKVQTNTESEDVEAEVTLGGLPKTFSSCPLRKRKTVDVVGTCHFPCPMVSIKAPERVKSSERVFTASAEVSDPDYDQEGAFEWTITNGIILDGQGTKEVRATCLASVQTIAQLK